VKAGFSFPRDLRHAAAEHLPQTRHSSITRADECHPALHAPANCSLSEHFRHRAGLITMAKSLGGWHVPIAAVTCRAEKS